MSEQDKVNILLVDDQPAKLLAYEVILSELGENLIKAGSGREALEHLLKTDVGVVLVDVSMPELDGFELVSMIRDHPRYEKTAIIFVSAIHLSEIDTVKGYAKGAVDYVSVPVIPEILRAKVRVFVDLYRKTRLLERLNSELEQHVTERTAALTEALDRQAILAREVDHRAKNALAVVQSILHLTRAEDVQTYVASVEGRIHALSRAHDLLSQSRWEGANLSRLIEEELAPYQMEDKGRIIARGPPVVLQPAVAQTLALALHELATNAAKYGALSASGGRVTVEWDLTLSSLSLTWRESGGPDISRPLAQGFGTKLLRLSIEGQLNGKIDFDWEPSGLFCAISIARDPHPAPPVDRPSSDETSGRLTHHDEHVRRRVLIVEDEALVAMMMVGFVEELGFAACGPFANVREATAALREGSCDGAVLDVNLGSEMVYPVADLLSGLGVPFVFVTGYSSDLVDKRFNSAPILQKPVQIADLERALRLVGVPRMSPTELGRPPGTQGESELRFGRLS